MVIFSLFQINFVIQYYNIIIYLLFYVGDFHFLMHVCHTIYCIGFIDYLQSIAELFGYSTLKKDFILQKWNKHDEFLLLFAEASNDWLCSML